MGWKAVTPPLLKNPYVDPPWYITNSTNMTTTAAVNMMTLMPTVASPPFVGRTHPVPAGCIARVPGTDNPCNQPLDKTTDLFLCKDHQPSGKHTPVNRLVGKPFRKGYRWVCTRAWEPKPCQKCSTIHRVKVTWYSDPSGPALINITWPALCDLCSLEARAERQENSARVLRDKIAKLKNPFAEDEP